MNNLITYIHTTVEFAGWYSDDERTTYTVCNAECEDDKGYCVKQFYNYQDASDYAHYLNKKYNTQNIVDWDWV